MRWTEIPGIFLFLGIIGGFIAIAVIDLQDYNKTKCFNFLFGDARVAFFDPSILTILSVSMALSMILTMMYYFVAVRVPNGFVHMSFALQLVVTLTCVVIYLVQTSWLSGALSVLWLLLSGGLYYILRVNMQTVTVELRITAQVITSNPSIIVISILGAVFSAAWSVLVAAVTIAGFSKTVSEECSISRVLRPEGQFLGILSFVAISHYTLSEVIKGAIRVAACNVFGWWYYMPNELPDSAEYARLHGVTWEGLFLALTYSLGSVALSSLILALSKLCAQVIGAWSQELMVSSGLVQTQDVSVIVLAWVASNCVWCLDSLLSHFTNYVLVHVALYNHSYVRGSRKALSLMYTEGVRAVANDCLAGSTFMFASWCIGTLAALAAYVYMRWIAMYDTDGIYFVTSFIVIVCVQISSVILVGMSSGIQTIFVAYSNDPHMLRETHAHVYELLHDD